MVRSAAEVVRRVAVVVEAVVVVVEDEDEAVAVAVVLTSCWDRPVLLMASAAVMVELTVCSATRGTPPATWESTRTANDGSRRSCGTALCDRSAPSTPLERPPRRTRMNAS